MSDPLVALLKESVLVAFFLVFTMVSLWAYRHPELQRQAYQPLTEDPLV